MDLEFAETRKVATVPCNRCGEPCRVAGHSNPDALFLKHATAPRGVCVNCAATNFLMNLYPANMDFDEKGPDCLRDPDLQRLFGGILAAGRADARLEEIDWGRVIANWDLPVKIIMGNPLNPYMPTHPRRARPDERYEPHCQMRNHGNGRAARTRKADAQDRPPQQRSFF